MSASHSQLKAAGFEEKRGSCVPIQFFIIVRVSCRVVFRAFSEACRNQDTALPSSWCKLVQIQVRIVSIIKDEQP